jgi:hypothetical protein
VFSPEDVPGLKPSQAGGHLTPTYYSSNRRLQTPSRYTSSALTAQKTILPTATPLPPVTQPLPSNGCFSGYIVLALSKYVTILYPHLLSNGPFLSEFPSTVFLRISYHSHPSQPPWRYRPNKICRKVQIMRLLVKLNSPASFTLFVFGSNILFSTFSQIPSICVLPPW